MSNNQGSLPFNTEVFAKLRAQIDAVQSPAALQQIADEAMGSINGMSSGITAQLAAIQPFLALIQPPGANPAQIVTWIKDFITAFINPYLKPAITLPIQIAALTSEVALMTASIQAAADRLQTPIVIPPVELPEVPAIPDPDPDPDGP